jgi:8-oxo-dGTP pyrophosphatase MutT (NUDIX family)
MDFIEKLENILEPIDAKVKSMPHLRLAAVLIPILKNEKRILFTQRTQTVKHHKGQISFPGGRFDKSDGAIMNTALRETKEEVGIGKEDITLIGRLNPMTTTSRYYVIPFVGLLEDNVQVSINTLEVEHCFFASIEELMDPENYLKGNFDGWNLPYYRYRGYKIWGITGQILTDLIVRLRNQN